MIHHATLGSIERFLSVFVEHTGDGSRCGVRRNRCGF